MGFSNREKLIIKLSINLSVVAMNPSKSKTAKQMLHTFAAEYLYDYSDALKLSNEIDNFLESDPND